MPTSSSESSSEVQNSATEISTDSEFAQDEPTPTREFNDFHVTKTRGSSNFQSRELHDHHVTKSRGNFPRKVQVKSSVLQKPANGRRSAKNVELKIAPLVPSPPPLRKPAPNTLLLRTEGYALNRTQSTGGIATKVSLELKKKYLLGETTPVGNIQKSGSASTLDSKLKSFHTNISDCQKLLKPASEVATMKPFTSKVDERTSPISPILLSQSPTLQEEKKEDTDKPEVTSTEKSDTEPFENVLEGRPRSPVHETSIIVPNIDWSEQKKSKKLSESFDDSLTSSSTSDEEVSKLPKSSSVKLFNNIIPKLEVHDDTGEIMQIDNEIALDSLNVCEEKPVQPSSILSEPPKSITSDKKQLNQPKTLPKNDDEMHSIIHNNLQESIASEKKIIEQKSEETADKEKKNAESMVSLIKDLGLKEDAAEVKSAKQSSGRSTPSQLDSCGDQATGALTETELSDWARDGAVSDDFEDVEFDLHPDVEARNSKVKTVKLVKLEDLNHICNNKNKEISPKLDCINSILHRDLENIEFMDTGTETSSDDNMDKNNGYSKFENEDEPLDSLTPVINNIVETRNPQIVTKAVIEDFDDVSTPVKNTGYCIFEPEKNRFGSEVIDLKPQDIASTREKNLLNEPEEDSLLIVDAGTTTEENTVSDSTVKNITEKLSPLYADSDRLLTKLEKLCDKSDLNELEKTDKLLAGKTMIDSDKLVRENKNDVLAPNENSSKEYEEHCQRLQSKVEFSNARDSIDIRKSRRRSKPDVLAKPDLIKEEHESPKKEITLTLTPAVAAKSPSGRIYKKEEIEKERNMNQKLIQEMVMNKMKAENKSLERKKRNRNSFSPNRPFELSKSATTDIASQFNQRKSTLANAPDVLLSTLKPTITENNKNTNFKKEANLNKFDIKNIHKSQTINAIADYNRNECVKLDDIIKTPIKNRPLSVHSSFFFADTTLKNAPNSETALSMPDIRDDKFRTPKAPPRFRKEEENARKTAEKLKNDARIRARLKSDEDLGLSPEDKLKKLKQRIKKDGDVHVQDSIESLVLNTERRNSLLYSNDTLKKKKNDSFKRSMSGDDSLRKLSTCKNPVVEGQQPTRTKSVSEIAKYNSKPLEISTENTAKYPQMCKSDPNLTNNTEVTTKKEKKRSKDRERNKSITKFISNILGSSKKKEPSKGIFGIISPKSKDKSKTKVLEEPSTRRSFSELTLHREQANVSPPPIPPLPANYARIRLNKDDSSDGENEWKKADKSSCDTLDQSGVYDGSNASLVERKQRKSVTKAVKQAQYKRHRMAQEIQRKLEETEVKSRELEQRGVQIEKALRGEGGSKENDKDESELLKEWFDLMRDITELKRYERELNVRAQELELEDRHARLQHELRERLENDDQKTKDDVEIEGSIIKEMMDIVAKRDSLIALLEEDRLRYSEEDRDFEDQMLSKGVPLTNTDK